MSEVAVKLTRTREEITKKKTHCTGKVTLDLLDKNSLLSSRSSRIAHLHLNEDLVVGLKFWEDGWDCLSCAIYSRPLM